jgi:hypothetical protein
MVAPEARYEQYFSTAPDPQQGNFLAAYREFLPGGPPDVRALCEALGSHDNAGAFAYLGRDDRIHLIHSLRRHGPSALGQARSLFTDRTIAVLDERTNVGTSFVEVLNNLFRDVREGHICPSAAITLAYDDDTTVEQLAALDLAYTGDSDTINTRRCILVPHPYVSSLLRTTHEKRGGICPQILWEDLLGAGLYHSSYSPFHDWVRLAASNGIGAANNLRADAAWEPPLIAPDASLGASRTSMECAIFPAAAAATISAPGALQGVVDALAAMRYDTTRLTGQP